MERAVSDRGVCSRKQLIWKPRGPAVCRNVAGLGEGSGSIRRLVGQESLATPRREGEASASAPGVVGGWFSRAAPGFIQPVDYSGLSLGQGSSKQNKTTQKKKKKTGG